MKVHVIVEYTTYDKYYDVNVHAVVRDESKVPEIMQECMAKSMDNHGETRTPRIASNWNDEEEAFVCFGGNSTIRLKQFTMEVQNESLNIVWVILKHHLWGEDGDWNVVPVAIAEREEDVIPVEEAEMVKIQHNEGADCHGKPTRLEDWQDDREMLRIWDSYDEFMLKAFRVNIQ